MIPVLFSPLAENDYLDIVDWLSDRSVASASRFIDAVEQALKQLRDFPMSGHESAMLDGPGLRILNVGAWSMIYESGNNRIWIVRLVHGSRELRSLRIK